MTRALSVDNLAVNYGGIKAVKGISFHVDAGEIVTLIGANGAGKSSTLKSIVRLVNGQGAITAFGQDLTKLQTHDVAASGIQLVPEGRAIFANMSVLENLDLGAYSHRFEPRPPPGGGRPGHSPDRAFLREAKLDEIFTLFPRLKERIDQLAGTLSGGEQQMLAIGRALMANPKMILLDEPSLGLAPKLVMEIFAAIRDIASKGLTILLVEQNTRLALETAARAYVMVSGEVAFSGPSAELREDPRVKAAYLGDAH